MSENLVTISKKIWPRDLAIHEAGHGIAAWFFGYSKVEICLAGTDRVAKTYMHGKVDDCRAVAAWNISYPRKTEELDKYALSSPDIRHALSDKVSEGIVCSLAGIVAQSRYTGENICDLMETAGKSDMRDVRDMAEVYHAIGGAEANIQNKSLTRARTLINLKWWDVIALAKILENRSHMPDGNFHAIMGTIDSYNPDILTLGDLDAMPVVV